MKRKILLPLLAISFSATTFAGECDYIIDAYKNLGRKTFNDLSVLEKDQLNSCIADNPGSENSTGYKGFKDRTAKAEQAKTDAANEQRKKEEILNNREIKNFDDKEINKYGMPVFAYKVEHLWASKDKPYKHSNLVRLTDANDYCKKKGYDKAGEVIIRAEANKKNQADVLSNKGIIIDDSWYKISNKLTPFEYEEDDYDREVEFKKPHVMKFESIECVRNSNKEDKLEDIMTVTVFKDELGNEQKLVVDNKEHSLNELFGNFMMGNDRADAQEKEIFNEDRNCSRGRKLGINYEYCSYGFDRDRDEQEEQDSELDSRNAGNNHYLPSSRLNDRFEKIKQRHNTSGASR